MAARQTFVVPAGWLVLRLPVGANSPLASERHSHTSDLRVGSYFLFFRDKNHTFETSKELRTVREGAERGLTDLHLH